MTKQWQLQSHQFLLFSHSVFPFCPLYPSVFCLISIIFHNLFLANISHLLPWLYLTCLNWSHVFVSCCRFLTSTGSLWLDSFSAQSLHGQGYLRNLSRAFLAMLFWVFFFIFSFHGLGIEEEESHFCSAFLSPPPPACFPSPVLFSLHGRLSARLNRCCICEGWQLNSTGRERERVRGRGKKMCERDRLQGMGGGTKREERGGKRK